MHVLNQARIQCPQARHMEFGAGLGQGSVGDVAQQACADTFPVLVGKEAVEFTLHAATPKAAQRGHQCRQGQLARTGECRGEIRVTSLSQECRALDVLGKPSQNRLDGNTDLRQDSCQSRENIQQNQQLAYFNSLSSVDWTAPPVTPKTSTDNLQIWRPKFKRSATLPHAVVAVA